MDIFEYLPQLIVAYDSNDEFANLIHVKKSNKDADYYCPCCGGIVKPRALKSEKEQSHYYHKTGKCTKESQLHFFCKNWLFENGSKFYIDDELFEVESIDIEKLYHTKFGDYKPDITVYTTCGKIIYFEMFFSNRKTGDDYFCKWNDLGNDVVEVNIKEYMFKTDEDVIPRFTYLYHDGVCYSKPYVKRDLYVNTIAKIKHELTRQKVLNYKARIEKLDWFWQKIINNDTKESILDAVSEMEYDDMVSCYEIIKKKQCVSFLKDNVLDIINNKVLSDFRESLNLPYDENVYFDLEHYSGRTYIAGIRLNINTNHIIYNDIYRFLNMFAFSRKIHNKDEIVIHVKTHTLLCDYFDETIKYKNEINAFEDEISNYEKSNNYKIKIVNNKVTVLSKINGNNYEPILEDKDFYILSIDNLNDIIEKEKSYVKCNKQIKEVLNNEKYKEAINELKSYKGMNFITSLKCVSHKEHGCNERYNICIELYLLRSLFYTRIIDSNDDFLDSINKCKNDINNILSNYSAVIDLVKKVNNCKNRFWVAEITEIQRYTIGVKISQRRKNIYNTEVIMHFDPHMLYNKVKKEFEKSMKQVLKNIEYTGCRVMEWVSE